jgi:hypothetical protein
MNSSSELISSIYADCALTDEGLGVVLKLIKSEKTISKHNNFFIFFSSSWNFNNWKWDVINIKYFQLSK